MSADIAVGLFVAAAVICPVLGRGRRARAVAANHAAPRGAWGWRPSGGGAGQSASRGRFGPEGWRLGMEGWRLGPERGPRDLRAWSRGSNRWLRRRPEGDRVLLVVTQVAALLRSGASPARAWRQAAGVPADDVGVPELVPLARRVGGEATAAAVVAACRLAVDVGAPLAAVLDQVAAVVADEAHAQAARDAAFAGPRTTARVLGWLPAVGVLLGMALGVDPVATAFDGGVGSAATGLGLVFLLAGRRWSARLLVRARRAGAPS